MCQLKLQLDGHHRRWSGKEERRKMAPVHVEVTEGQGRIFTGSEISAQIIKPQQEQTTALKQTTAQREKIVGLFKTRKNKHIG